MKVDVLLVSCTLMVMTRPDSSICQWEDDARVAPVRLGMHWCTFVLGTETWEASKNARVNAGFKGAYITESTR